MIEAVMLAALGFLVATVLWLLLLPAISNRADRLARRRAELSFPISVDEISAERDHLRAEFAVRQREIERRAEDHQAARSAALGTVGGLDMQISELKTTLGVRDVAIVNLEANLASTQTELAGTQARLAFEEAGHAATRDDLAQRIKILVERDKEIAGLRMERADLTATLAARVRDLAGATSLGEQLSADLQRTSAALATLQGEHANLQAEAERLALALGESEALAAARAVQIEGLEARLTAIEARLAAEQAGHVTTRAAFEQRGTELGQLSAERESMTQRLRASDDAGARLEQALKDTRSAKATSDSNHAASLKEVDKISALLRKATEDKARIEVEAASARRERDARIATLTTDLATAQEVASASRAERSGLKQELTQLRRDAERATLRLDAENAQLRAEILKVADQFLGLRSAGGRSAIGQDKVAAAAGMTKTVAEPSTKPPRAARFAKPAAASLNERISPFKQAGHAPVPDRAAE